MTATLCPILIPRAVCELVGRPYHPAMFPAHPPHLFHPPSAPLVTIRLTWPPRVPQ
jgi:hypothetical protein